jgi:hypothetical protein
MITGPLTRGLTRALVRKGTVNGSLQPALPSNRITMGGQTVTMGGKSATMNTSNP